MAVDIKHTQNWLCTICNQPAKEACLQLVYMTFNPPRPKVYAQLTPFVYYPVPSALQHFPWFLSHRHKGNL
ncbi:hypothetical protein K474DRAFT_1666176 [Panus rudis PR-1116 ss-1]|nr:hypothetical protein K474DRAFT_1666176 [Panus rudis PR-1116 ss-1]